MSRLRKAVDIEYSLPVHGRIRVGTKNEKGWPISLKTFRFTSSDQSAVTTIADEFGGVVKPWKNGKNSEWEVITEASEIPVVLPPKPIDGPIWEYWSKGGKLFDCDGETCIKTSTGPDGLEYESVPCRCKAENKLVCKPQTRLRVLLHNVALGGCWLLNTGSKMAASELQAMVQVVELMYNQTLTPAKLAIEPRSSASGGQTRHFVVPVLRAGATLVQLQQQQQALTELKTIELDAGD